MTIIDFYKNNGLNPTIERKESKKSCYSDSETPIQFILLEKALDTGQTYLVLSRSLAEDITAGKLTIKDANVSFSNGRFGLIRPDNSTVLETVNLW